MSHRRSTPNDPDEVTSMPRSERPGNDPDEDTSMPRSERPGNDPDEDTSMPRTETPGKDQDEFTSMPRTETPGNDPNEVASMPRSERPGNDPDEITFMPRTETPGKDQDEFTSMTRTETLGNDPDEDTSIPRAGSPGEDPDEVKPVQCTEMPGNDPDEDTSIPNTETPGNDPDEDTSIPRTETPGNKPDEDTSIPRTETPGNAITLPASSRDGDMSADDAYDKYLQEYHPNYNEKVYRVPWTFIGKSPAQTKKEPYKLSNNEKFPQWSLDEEHIQGDNAEKRVADSLEWLLKTEEYPAFILTSYNFRNFCDQKDESPPDDKNVGAKKGEHDIVIIHYKYGIFFIQVKSCEKGDGNAKDQLKTDKGFFNDNFNDLKVTKSVIVALPNIDENSVPEHGSEYEYLVDDHLPCYSEEPEERKKKLQQWWNTITNKCTGFASFADYRRVVGKYVGYKSTVKAPMIQKPESIRSPAEVVAGMGNRYMNITLTPQQIVILNSHLPRLIIRGEYGSGKTILLILKARQMMVKEVCIISMAKSPLLRVLEDSVRYDMHPSMVNNIIIKQVVDISELTKVLQSCAVEKRHVFIDEVPSCLENNETLKNVINSYPHECWIWAIMSCERDDNLKQSLGEIFQHANRDFDVAVLNKVLRCPPSIFPRCKKTAQRVSPFNFEETEVIKFFESLGLPRQSPPKSDSRSLKWSDVTVVNLIKKQSNIVQWLDHLNCQPESLPKMIEYTEEQFKSKLDQLKDTGKIIFTDRLPPFYAQSYKELHFEEGGEIYINKETDYIGDNVTSQRGLRKLFLSHYSRMNKEQGQEIMREDNTIIFVCKPYLYYFFEKLKFPLVTPFDNEDVLRKDAIMFTDEQNLAGFERKMVLRISNTDVLVNQEPPRTEGPRPLTVDHKGHTNPVDQCTICQSELIRIFHELGLVMKQESSSVMEQESSSVMEQGSTSFMKQESNNENVERSNNFIEQHKYPSSKLGLCDVIVLDDRKQQTNDVVDLLKTIGINTMTEVDPYGHEHKVVYTTPEMFRGLEKKVVVVVTDNGYTDLALSRCCSQLIVLNTDANLHVDNSDLEEKRSDIARERLL